jgi:predicted aldo/keto reductase-like oxidoreductase
MQYRTFGRLDWPVSALGFGCMRLPTRSGDRLDPNVLEDEAIRMIHHAIDQGVNYVDTAYPYHGGQSELVVGKALRGGYRERVRLATKLPVWLVKRPDDFDTLLGEQLQKLQTDHIDCYLLHALNTKRWRDVTLKHGLLARAAAAVADGRIRQLGFSIHDEYPVFEEIVQGTDLWSFCQIQYNYMDIENQAGTRGLHLAAARNLAVVVMEPLLGGRLVDPPADVRQVMEGAPVRRSPADWALQWLWDQPEVSVVLSGMTTMTQLEENLRSAENARVRSFSESEHAFIALVRALYLARTAVPCNRCGYCMPCPSGVNIPDNFDHFNHAHLFDDVAGARLKNQIFLPPEQRSAACIGCRECEELCPQNIEVSEWMKKVSALLGT